VLSQVALAPLACRGAWEFFMGGTERTENGSGHFFFFLNLSVAKMSTLLLIDGHVKILLLLLHLSLCNSNLGGLVLTTLLSFHFWRVRNGFATANEARRKFSVF
jgi:hypothetical protein